MYFQIAHRGIVKVVYTDLHIMEDEWDDATSSFRKTVTPARRALLQLVASKAQWIAGKITAIITKRETSRVEYDVDDILSDYRQIPPFLTWFEFISDMAEKKEKGGRTGTSKTYRNALASFTQFRGKEDLAPDALDAATITRYEEWLKARGLKRNSVSCYLRTLRTLYHKAVEAELTTDKGIFRHVFTGFANNSKRAISMAEVCAVKSLSLREGTPIAFARDVFILSIYLQGISFVDLAYLKKSDIQDGLLLYDRRKTGQNICVFWEKPMRDIVEKYAHLTEGTPYLLPIITQLDGKERCQYEKAEHNVNRNLKKVGRMADLHIPLSTYVARHTWASTMRDMGCDLSIVSAGMGHMNLKTTQVYLTSINAMSVAKANKKMIGKIVRGSAI